MSPSRSNAKAPPLITIFRSIPPANWRTGKRVEEFIGDQQQRRIGQILDPVMENGVRHQGRLRVAKHRAGLDQMEGPAKPERRSTRKRIGRQCPAARPELGINGVARRARPPPAIGERGADHLAEQLADFGRGGEIARSAERIAGGVIMSVAGVHIGLDADPPSASMRSLSARSNGGHATLAGPAMGSTRTRRFFAVSIG